MDNLWKKTAVGLIYKFLERISVQVAGFIVSVILARLLFPEQFGSITLIAVVITILDVFVQSGFGNSLIVNQKSDDLDFSTCFYFGLFLSSILYIIFYFLAPYISVFFNDEELTPVMRVMALRVPLGAVNSVQHAYVSKLMIFRKFFISTSIGTIISGVLAVIMAICGYGIWSLVAQYIGNVLIDTVCLSCMVKWRPKLMFSFERLKAIYDYGWKILISGLIDTIYSQSRSLIIARKYSSADLAFYGRGLSFPNLANSAIEPAIDGVIFPALSNCNDNKVAMKSIARRMIMSTSFLLFPIMTLLFAASKPLILVVLTEKWLESVPYLQIFCLAYMFRPIQVINNCVIKASGDSALLLKLDVIKKTIGFIVLIFCIPFGSLAVAFSLVIFNVIATVINIWPNRAILTYGYMEQVKDILPSLLASMVMGIFVFGFSYFNLPAIYLLLIQIISGVSLYILFAALSKSESYKYIKSKLFFLSKS